MDAIKGRIWAFGDNVDTDQIIPAERLLAANLGHLNDYIFEKVRPGFAAEVRPGDILVAGRNFGCGSSREHAPLSLREAGFSCIIAESFARIFYRNSMDTGLLLVECKVDAEEGETAEVDVDAGKVKVGDREYTFPEYPPFITELIKTGGLMNLIKEGKFQ